jgi:hypothetical protein
MTIKAQIDPGYHCAMEHKSGPRGERCSRQCSHCYVLVRRS